MASEPVKLIGEVDCICCGKVMPVRQNGRDTLNISCPWCGLSAYAKGGTEAHKIIGGWMRKSSPDEPEKSPAPAPVAPPVPAPSPIKSLLDMVK